MLAVQERFALVKPLLEDYVVAQELLRRYQDQKITLFDSVLFVLAQRLNSYI
jgi:hypothetical protein